MIAIHIKSVLPSTEFDSAKEFAFANYVGRAIANPDDKTVEFKCSPSAFAEYTERFFSHITSIQDRKYPTFEFHPTNA